MMVTAITAVTIIEDIRFSIRIVFISGIA
jgi:hypothetical protein